MRCFVRLKASKVHQQLLMEKCPFGIWRSSTGEDSAGSQLWVVEFKSDEDAEKFKQCAQLLGCATEAEDPSYS